MSKTVVLKGSMGSIAEQAMQPVQRGENAVSTETLSVSDMQKGVDFYTRTIALLQTQAAPWSALVHEAFGMSLEARSFAVEKCQAWLKERKAMLKNVHPNEDPKKLVKLVNTATVRLSQMRSCLKAMNNGMDRGTIALARNIPEDQVPDVGFDAIYQVARDFNGSTAGAPKQKTLIEDFAAFVKKHAKVDHLSAGDKRILKALVETVNEVGHPDEPLTM